MKETAGTYFPKKLTHEVKAGSIVIGGKNPVVIQEMCSTLTKDLPSTISQLRDFQKLGIKLARVAVPDEESARAIKILKKEVVINLVADIQFNHRFAIIAIENGVDKIRLNPGNISSRTALQRIVSLAKERSVPIRVGVNSGSLEKNLLLKYGGPTPEAMVESALKQVLLLEKLGFSSIVISLKSPDVMLTIRANRLMSEKVDYPLHVGVTEAGVGEISSLVSAVGIGLLLLEGIGDTIRVSLSYRDRFKNIMVARKILEALSVPYT